MSIGGGKEWRRWRNVGGIMGKRHSSEEELRSRFGMKGGPMNTYEKTRNEIAAAREASLAKLVKERGDALIYATRLAVSLWETHWKDDAPHWKPLPDLMGVLTQIDNMTAGLVRADGQTLRSSCD